MTRHPTLVAAGATVRALLRRRAAMAILVALPLTFYLVRRDAVGQAVRSLTFGISWAVATVAFFAAAEVRGIEPRLQLGGWRRRQLVTGRLLGLAVVAAGIMALFTSVIVIDQPQLPTGAVVVDFAVTAVVAIAVGSAVGALVEREMEGALAIFFLAGLQAVVNPFDTWALVLPFWSSRELATVAVDGAAEASTRDALVHAAVVVALGAAVAIGSTARPGAGARRRPRPTTSRR